MYVQDRLRCGKRSIGLERRPALRLLRSGRGRRSRLQPARARAAEAHLGVVLPRAVEGADLAARGHVVSDLGQGRAPLPLRSLLPAPDLEFLYDFANNATAGNQLVGNAFLTPKRRSPISSACGASCRIGCSSTPRCSSRTFSVSSAPSSWRRRTSTSRTRSLRTLYVNKDYGSVRGFELSIDKNFRGLLAGRSLVHAVARHRILLEREPGRGRRGRGLDREPIKEVPLDWDLTHVFHTYLYFSDPGVWGLNFDFDVATGEPTTPKRLGQRTTKAEDINTIRLPFYMGSTCAGTSSTRSTDGSSALPRGHATCSIARTCATIARGPSRRRLTSTTRSFSRRFGEARRRVQSRGHDRGARGHSGAAERPARLRRAARVPSGDSVRVVSRRRCDTDGRNWVIPEDRRRAMRGAAVIAAALCFTTPALANDQGQDASRNVPRSGPRLDEFAGWVTTPATCCFTCRTAAASTRRCWT